MSTRNLIDPRPHVVFCGVDGAGKSTQIERLAAHFRSVGLYPVLLWSRIGYTPGMQFFKWALRGILGSRIVPESGPTPARTQALSRPWVRRWWLRLAIVDLLWRFAVVTRWHRLLGRPVICDRYLEDSLIDAKLHFPTESVGDWWLWKLLRMLAAKPTHRFLLLVPVDVYLRRSAEKNEPFPLTSTGFEDRYRLYAAESRNDKWHVLDGRCSVNELADEILAAVDPVASTNTVDLHRA